MTAKLMDGRKLSELLKPQLRAHARELSDRYGVIPALAAIMVGDNAASAQYVRNKRKFAEELGFRSEIIAIPDSEASTERLLETIARLNADEGITGILLQLPVPEGIDNFRAASFRARRAACSRCSIITRFRSKAGAPR
jgi:methylenetetrahydrofolate dehydrogenase (NADP+)/methenyltetrahydrofolate cyclohydrolase